VAMLLTLLPPRYREGMHLRGPAITCSLVQIVGAILILILRIYRLAAAGQSPLPGDPKEMFTTYGGNYLAANSVAGMAAFWFHPLHMVLYYCVFEGGIRLMSALEGERILGSLPLYAVLGIPRLFDKAAHKRSLGPLIVDEIVLGGGKAGYDLKVCSCRPKLSWNPYITIEFKGQFYQMFKEEPGSSPRRFTYYLRNNPTGRIVVVIEHYHVDDVLKPPRDKDSWQQLRDKLISGLDPVMEDQIFRGTERSGYDLKIYSSRPKLEWNSQVTIEFESRLYEMFKEESAPKPRRFVYYLRRNPEGRLQKGILPYKAEKPLKG